MVLGSEVYVSPTRCKKFVEYDGSIKLPGVFLLLSALSVAFSRFLSIYSRLCLFFMATPVVPVLQGKQFLNLTVPSYVLASEYSPYT